MQEGAIPKAASRWRQSALRGRSALSSSPAVFHKVMNNFVQDLLKQGGADPQVFDGEWGQVRQLWQLPHILLEALDLVSPSRPVKEEKRYSQEKI